MNNSMAGRMMGVILKNIFQKWKIRFTFAATVLATLTSERIAYQGESFAFTGFLLILNTPPMPLLLSLQCTPWRFFH